MDKKTPTSSTKSKPAPKQGAISSRTSAKETKTPKDGTKPVSKPGAKSSQTCAKEIKTPREDTKKQDKNAENDNQECQEWRDLPQHIKDKLKEYEGQPSKKAATFIIHSVKQKSLDVSADDVEKLVDLADKDDLNESIDEKSKELVTSDGKKINIASLLDKRNKGKDTTEVMESAVSEAESGTVTQSSTSLAESTDSDQNNSDNKMKKDEFSELKKKFDDREVELKEKEREIAECNSQIQTLLKQDSEYEKMNLKYHDRIEELEALCKSHDQKIQDKTDELREKIQTIGRMEKQLEELKGNVKEITNDKEALESQFSEAVNDLKQSTRKIEMLEKNYGEEMREKNNQVKQLKEERDDLKLRFSKLAGERLTEQNPDIADLSDPNRAMKVSDKFGQLYDDQWTDAFEYLQNKKKMKKKPKEAITLLLEVLRRCEDYLNKLKETQMDSLRNVLLHPAQDVSKFGSEPRKHVEGLKEHMSIKSDDHKAISQVRRQMGVSQNVLEEVKQVFLSEVKTWKEKDLLDGCKPYIEKCAEVCWLMVITDPPIYMMLDVKSGDNFEPSLFSKYDATGDKIDYLVWPPLFVCKGGGLLKKGTAEPIEDGN